MVNLKVWSNGRFRSSEHRVVVNGQSDRYSIVYLIQGPVSPDFVVQCPPELVDDAHPSLYVPYTYADYRANFESLVARGLVGRGRTLAFALRKDREGQHDKE
jgi:isopenicillin N synthase-like dioxygenase